MIIMIMMTGDKARRKTNLCSFLTRLSFEFFKYSKRVEFLQKSCKQYVVSCNAPTEFPQTVPVDTTDTKNLMKCTHPTKHIIQGGIREGPKRFTL